MIDNKARLYAEAISTARGILSGQIGVIPGSRTLTRIGSNLDENKRDSFLLFIGIDSESDDLAIGPERQYWAKEALAKQDIEIKISEAYYKEEVFNACQDLIDLLESELIELSKDQ